ncbi:MAG: hypothetical protein ACI9R3_001957 [Verrucomicrobiales bacterium]
MIPGFIDGLVLAPDHLDLQAMADTAAEFLTERFSSMPQDSGVTKFLATENEHASDIKRKLVWLGTESYLFRGFFSSYQDEQGKEPGDISVIESFVCEECTEWCGLGVADILVEAIGLNDEDAEDLLSWRDRHTALFRIIDTKKDGDFIETLTSRNIVNGEDYLVSMNMIVAGFECGMVFFGALTRWRGTWYWSGEQRRLGKVSSEKDEELRWAMFEESSQSAYRYCEPEAEKARKVMAEHHTNFVQHYEDDLVVFADGLTLAETERKRMAEMWAAAPKEDVEHAMQSQGLERPEPRMSFPPEFMNHDQGISAYSSPEEGIEYCINFHQLSNGMQKQGVDLSEAELETIRGVVVDSSCSVAFIRRLVSDSGPQSIAWAFLIRNQSLEWVMETLLRRYKGSYYRKRYPRITLVDS